ncbi:hypothetical protein HMPREF1981_00229, partial [Bacteroides pyogenes F0041]
ITDMSGKPLLPLSITLPVITVWENEGSVLHNNSSHHVGMNICL